jgi:hypothetical protein
MELFNIGTVIQIVGAAEFSVDNLIGNQMLLRGVASEMPCQYIFGF